MPKNKSSKDVQIELTAPVKEFISYFSELGPRWGLNADTCLVHALLYLSGSSLTKEEIKAACDLTDREANAAVTDLLQWKVASETERGIRINGGEPVDLMFSALEERGRREIQQALELLRSCESKALKDDEIPDVAAKKISAMLKLVEDLAALDSQSRRITSRPFSRLVGFGGRTARLVNRVFPVSERRKRND
jgi:DNA-binding transcriptional regulator GbsR (MarR family)